ncbi:MAG TPA: glycosyltransferase family 39 protein, partial [Stenomitos sp.]
MTQLLRNGLKASWQYSVQRSICLPLALLFGLSLWLVSPVGEFPLNDDWIYTKTVQHLLETGQYQAHPYLNATLVVQTYWGALFCKLFGFSFTTLRCSTLVLAWLNAWAVAQCALVMGLTRKLALLCAAVIATSPLVLQLSYSFMTDVPFLTFSSLSGLCFLKAMAKPQPKWVALGSGCAVLAFGVRQFGILLPLAFAIAAVRLAWQRQYKISRDLKLALLLPWSLAIALYLGWGKALTSSTPILEPIAAIDGPVMDGLRHIPVALCYIGLFTLPLGIGRLRTLFNGIEPWTKQQWQRFRVFCGVSLLMFSLPQGLAHLKRFFLHEGSVWLERYPARMPLMVYRT